jgi:hypothetical protein
MPRIYPVLPNPPSLVFDCHTGGDWIDERWVEAQSECNLTLVIDVFVEVPLAGGQ